MKQMFLFFHPCCKPWVGRGWVANALTAPSFLVFGWSLGGRTTITTTRRFCLCAKREGVFCFFVPVASLGWVVGGSRTSWQPLHVQFTGASQGGRITTTTQHFTPFRPIGQSPLTPITVVAVYVVIIVSLLIVIAVVVAVAVVDAVAGP